MSLRKRKKQCIANTDTSKADMEVDFHKQVPSTARRNANETGAPLAPLLRTSLSWMENPRSKTNEFVKGNDKQEGLLPENRPLCPNPNASLPSRGSRYLANHQGGSIGGIAASACANQPSGTLRYAAPNLSPNGFRSQLVVPGPPESHITNPSPITNMMAPSQAALVNKQPIIAQMQTRRFQATQSGPQTQSLSPDTSLSNKGLAGHLSHSGQPPVVQQKVYIGSTHAGAPNQGTMEINDRHVEAHPSEFGNGNSLLRARHTQQVSPQLVAVPHPCRSTQPLVQEIMGTNGDGSMPISAHSGGQNRCGLMENRSIVANTNGVGVLNGNGRVHMDELVEMHNEQLIRRSSRILNRNENELPPQYPMPTGPPVMNYPFMQAKSDWTEHVAPDGRRYWWNKSLAESTWRKPEGIRLAEEFLASAKGWKVKTSATGRRMYEHMVTHNCSLDLPAAVQNEFEGPPKKTAVPKEKPKQQIQIGEKSNFDKQMANGGSEVSPDSKLHTRYRLLGEMLVDRDLQIENLRRQVAIFVKLKKLEKLGKSEVIATLQEVEGLRLELDAEGLVWAFDKIVQQAGNAQQEKGTDAGATSDEQQDGGGVLLEDKEKSKCGVPTRKEGNEATKGETNETIKEQQISPEEEKPAQEMDTDGNQNE